MKQVVQVLSISFLALLQTIVLPINLALLFILLTASSQRVESAAAPILVGSFFVAIFGNLNFGASLIGFSVSLSFFFLLKRFLPNELIFKIVSVLLALVFWEILLVGIDSLYLSKI